MQRSVSSHAYCTCRYGWARHSGSHTRVTHGRAARPPYAPTLATLPYPTQMLMSMIVRKCLGPQQAFVGTAPPAAPCCMTQTAEHRSLLTPQLV